MGEMSKVAKVMQNSGCIEVKCTMCGTTTLYNLEKRKFVNAPYHPRCAEAIAQATADSQVGFTEATLRLSTFKDIGAPETDRLSFEDMEDILGYGKEPELREYTVSLRDAVDKFLWTFSNEIEPGPYNTCSIELLTELLEPVRKAMREGR